MRSDERVGWDKVMGIMNGNEMRCEMLLLSQ